MINIKNQNPYQNMDVGSQWEDILEKDFEAFLLNLLPNVNITTSLLKLLARGTHFSIAKHKKGD